MIAKWFPAFSLAKSRRLRFFGAASFAAAFLFFLPLFFFASARARSFASNSNNGFTRAIDLFSGDAASTNTLPFLVPPSPSCSSAAALHILNTSLTLACGVLRRLSFVFPPPRLAPNQLLGGLYSLPARSNTTSRAPPSPRRVHPDPPPPLASASAPLASRNVSNALSSLA